jgi:hypothetical protein
MHELLEQGFEVAVIKDATAAAQIPDRGIMPRFSNYTVKRLLTQNTHV